ncbi:MAG: RdgB/HAM1 family non-canonical purine NTP pyrophosphatase [Phycisphaerales bacterium]|nr:RdgB/HAM1 family non-canonical purine NTP pyrophosphatase [Phycisphaerales bacterium]
MASPILVATSNPHKLAEIAAVLGPLGLRVVGLDAADVNVPEPVEDGETFEANARLKAVYYARHAQRPCLADDSGLEVEALGGRPGVHSARYAGVGATRGERDAANNAKLLGELRTVPPERRAARFVCAMCLADAAGRVLAETRGEFPGVLIDEPRGTNGFGYDPLLLLPDVGWTSAELSPAEKNARSHRGFAARAMAQRIREAASGTQAPAPRA